MHSARRGPLFVQYPVKKEPTAQRTSELRHRASCDTNFPSSQAHGELPYLMNRVPDLQWRHHWEAFNYVFRATTIPCIF